MASISRAELDALIAADAASPRQLTELDIRPELESWLAGHLGIGRIGGIRPHCSGLGYSYETASAVIEGIELDERQSLEITRSSIDDYWEKTVLIHAYLYTSDDGLPQSESESSTGVFISSLSDLQGHLL
jgi:hypothetical protein